MFREIFWIKDLSCPECHAALTKTDEEVRYESDHADVYFCHHCKKWFILKDDSALFQHFVLKDDTITPYTQFASCCYIADDSKEFQAILRREESIKGKYRLKTVSTGNHPVIVSPATEIIQIHSNTAAISKDPIINIDSIPVSVHPGISITNPSNPFIEKFEYLYTTYTDFAGFYKYAGIPFSVYEALTVQYQPGSKPLAFAVTDTKIELELRGKIQKYVHIRHEIETKKRAAAIRDFFEENYECNGSVFCLDEEQSLAIADDAKHILISARAGSGKTRVIASKILYLLDYCHVPSGAVMALSFNVVVKNEINDRICHDIRKKGQEKDRLIPLANTFHSLAYSCDPSHEKILAEKNQKRFIRLLIEDMKETDELFLHRVYNAFRNENYQVNRAQFQSEESYYEFLRNQTFTTLKGEFVKSLGEKWIADYLYEHGIEYIYERQFYPHYIKSNTLHCTPEEAKSIEAFLEKNYRTSENGRRIRKAVVPDFFLPKYDFVWEHWGITGYETEEEKRKFGLALNTTWNDYKFLKDWKIKFWNLNWRKILRKGNKSLDMISSVNGLIETDVGMLKSGRIAFEEKLSLILKKKGIFPQKRNEQELIQEVWERQITRFSTLMESFINKYEQKFPGVPVSQVREQISASTDDRSIEFNEIGLDVIESYNKALSSINKSQRLREFENYNCDFNQLMHKAAVAILSGNCDNIINQIRYLLIDEYQDFSQLFFNFINAIIERNNEVQLFCVGDSWQAINSFMGADTKYFEQYKKYFQDSKQRSIAKNYRSAANIVTRSSNFMKECRFSGEPAEPVKSFNAEIFVKDIKDEYLEMRQEDSNYKTHQQYQQLLNSDCTNPFVGKYMKYCLDIIANSLKCGDDRILILLRTRKFLHVYDIEEVERKIKNFMRNTLHYSESDAGKVSVRTMHGSKGDEADTVIILEANTRQMPLLHPDNALFGLFGVTEEEVVKDEERLFYVAVTRARRRLYIAYDNVKSSFVSKYMSESRLPVSK